MHRADTIVAVATASGRAGIGVVRMSGPSARDIASRICARALEPRRASLASFYAGGGGVIDRGIVILFCSPHSYTGEDVVELQGHGGPAVLRLLTGRCIELGARPAEPGEFTERAFLNGKLDLVQAESVADLIDASSAAGVRSAMQSLIGVFSEHVHRVADGLLQLRMFVEAALDFPEDDVDMFADTDIAARLAALLDRLKTLREEAVQGRLLREGTRAVLIGRPNVGKSSLMNRLAREEVAIVTDVPGTTRDALRYELAIEGVPVHVVDTAGLRAAGDEVERLGIERTLAELRNADIALVVVQATDCDAGDPLAQLAIVPDNVKTLKIINKIDLAKINPRVEKAGSGKVVWVSAKTGEGMDLLSDAILELAGWQSGEDAPFMARERHLVALRDCDSALKRAQLALGQWDIFAEELRLAHRALGRITGETSADDLLGEIFSKFCIGK